MLGTYGTHYLLAASRVLVFARLQSRYYFVDSGDFVTRARSTAAAVKKTVSFAIGVGLHRDHRTYERTALARNTFADEITNAIVL